MKTTHNEVQISFAINGNFALTGRKALALLKKARPLWITPIIYLLCLMEVLPIRHSQAETRSACGSVKKVRPYQTAESKMKKQIGGKCFVLVVWDQKISVKRTCKYPKRRARKHNK